MDNREPVSGINHARSNEPSLAVGQVFINGFALLVIELDFVLKLIRLIQGHASLGYVLNAAVIQLCLTMAAVSYWRIWRGLPSDAGASFDRERVLSRVGNLVWCLLFALMFYPHYVELAAKVSQ